MEVVAGSSHRLRALLLFLQGGSYKRGPAGDFYSYEVRRVLGA